MMGRLNHDQEELFYSFRLSDAVPDDHLVRRIADVLDLSWVHRELAPYYPKIGRPSIDPVLMIRMLIAVRAPLVDFQHEDLDRNVLFSCNFLKCVPERVLEAHARRLAIDLD